MSGATFWCILALSVALEEEGDMFVVVSFVNVIHS